MSSKFIDQLFEELIDDKSASGGRLVILVGLPYSGKSTFAKALETYGFVHVWATLIRKQHEIPFEEVEGVTALLVGKLLAAGYLVVFDYLNHTAAVRRVFNEIAESLGVPCETVWLNPSAEVRWARRARSLRDEPQIGRSHLSEERMDLIDAEFELPTGRYIELRDDGDWTRALANLGVV